MNKGFFKVKTFFLNTLVMEVAFYIFLFSMAFLFLGGSSFRITPDGAWYLSNALNIYNGLGYVDTTQIVPVTLRGPVFPSLLAIAGKINGGLTIHSSYLLLRSLYICNMILISMLGKKFFGTLSAFLIILLFIVSDVFNLWSSMLLLDNCWPFVLLLAGFFIYLGVEMIEKGNIWSGNSFFILSALGAGIAFLIKDVSILIYPFPIVFVLYYSWRQRKKFLSALIYFYSISFAFYFLWYLYVYIILNDVKSVVLVAPYMKNIIITSFTLSSIFKIFRNLYCHYLNNTFPFSSLVVLLSWGWFFYKGLIKKERQYGFFFILLLFTAPLLYIVGGASMRAGQLFYVYDITIISVSVFAVDIFIYLIKRIDRTIKWRFCKYFTYPLLLVGIIIYFGFFLIRTNKFCFSTIINSDSLKIDGWVNPQSKELTEWLRGYIPPKSNILCEWCEADIIYFLLSGENKLFPIPLRSTSSGFPGDGHNQKIPLASFDSPGNILFIWPNVNKIEAKLSMTVWALAENDVMSIIKQRNICFILLTPRRGFMHYYFDQNPSFIKISELTCDSSKGGSYRLYKVVAPVIKLDTFDIRVGSNLGDFLNQKKQKDKSFYNMLVKNYFGNYLGLESQIITKIEYNCYPLFYLYK